MGLCSRFRGRRRRIAEAKRKAAQSRAIGKHIDQQWPEIREAAAWARDTREQNHLTELFFANRGGD